MTRILLRLALAASLAFAAAPVAAKQVCVEELSGVCLKFKEVPDAPAAKAPPKKKVQPQRQISAAERAERGLNLSRADRRGIQAALRNLGYYTGGIDGALGRGSRGAIRAWQRDRGLKATGFLASGQINSLAQQAAAKAQPAPAPPQPAAPQPAAPKPAAPKPQVEQVVATPLRDPQVGKNYAYQHGDSAWDFRVTLDVVSADVGRMNIRFATAQSNGTVTKSCDVPLTGQFECKLVYYVTQAGSTDAFFRGSLPNVSVEAQNLYENFQKSFSMW